LNLAENTGLFLDRYILGSCIFVSWNSKYILIKNKIKSRNKIKSSYLEYIEIINNIEEILYYINYITGL
jgi:hypothetical protein